MLSNWRAAGMLALGSVCASKCVSATRRPWSCRRSRSCRSHWSKAGSIPSRSSSSAPSSNASEPGASAVARMTSGASIQTASGRSNRETRVTSRTAGPAGARASASRRTSARSAARPRAYRQPAPQQPRQPDARYWARRGHRDGGEQRSRPQARRRNLFTFRHPGLHRPDQAEMNRNAIGRTGCHNLPFWDIGPAFRRLRDWRENRFLDCRSRAARGARPGRSGRFAPVIGRSDCRRVCPDALRARSGFVITESGE